MAEKKKSQTITRRKFMKGFGGGVVGGTVLARTLPGFSQDKKSDQQPHEGKAMLDFKVNGKRLKILVEPRATLTDVLREELQLTGTKIVCNQGQCGGCTVLLDDKAVYSCMLLALDANGKEVTTIEGLMDGEKINDLQQAFIDKDGMQCGFCTPGQIMAAHALLLENPHPSRDQVVKGMSGNICRCAAYPKIVDSVLAAAEKVLK